MFLWRKFAEFCWVKAHENLLQALAHGQLVIVRRLGRKRLELEIACGSRSESSALLKEFGGHSEALPCNWLERFARPDSKPIKIGKRLMIVRSINEVNSRSVRCSQRSFHHADTHDALRTTHCAPYDTKPARLVIPASLAFGTGEHVTTAMSLRFLEQLTRRWNPGWSVVDLGTGSGILALAGKCLGAGRVVGIDNDPRAISMAKSNARLNRIRGAGFVFGDVGKWNSAQETDVITANLYSNLLIEMLPKLRGSGWLILSGVLRREQDELVRALQRNHLDIINMKHRGKWIAILAGRTGTRRTPDLEAASFCDGRRPPLQ